MRISKYIDIQQEIEVDVTAEEIAAALAEEPITSRQALMAVNNAAKVIKGLTPEMIEQFGEPARKIIANFFTEQAARFSSNTTMSNGSAAKNPQS